MIQRRTFLQLIGAASAAIGFKTYSEPLSMLFEPSRHEWIEDKGDFVIIRVPDHRMFANETIAKPAIMLLGAGAIAKNLEFHDFLNLEFQRGASFSESIVDCSRSASEQRRGVIRIRGFGGTLRGTHVKSNSRIANNLEIEQPTTDMYLDFEMIA